MPQKEIKIRIRWVDNVSIKKLLKNHHITVLTKKRVKNITKFAREATLREWARQVDRMRKRVHGKKNNIV